LIWLLSRVTMGGMSDREPITIPAGACVYCSGNDGYAEFEKDGKTVRVRVVFRGGGEVRDGGTLTMFNTDELVDA
jgi:hypothetical protein